MADSLQYGCRLCKAQKTERLLLLGYQDHADMIMLQVFDVNTTTGTIRHSPLLLWVWPCQEADLWNADSFATRVKFPTMVGTFQLARINTPF